MSIKIDAADKLFSQIIRLRDKECQRCGSQVRLNTQGLPVSHHNSHYWGRGKESTRYDLENCDTLCYPCHTLWGGDERVAYKAFKIKQLGKKKFAALILKAHSPGKKDRKAERTKWREKLKEVL